MLFSSCICGELVGVGEVVIAVVTDAVVVVVVAVAMELFPSETTELARLRLTVRCLAGMGGGRERYGAGRGGGLFLSLPD